MMILKDTARLFTLSWKHNRRLMAAACCVVLLTSLVPFVQSYAVSELLNSLVSQSSDRIWFFLGMLLAAGLVISFANTTQFFIKTVLYKELFQFLAVLIHRKVAELEIRTHEDPQKKDLITKVQDNAMWRAPDYMQRMIYLVQNSIEFMAATVILFTSSALLGAVVVVTGLPRMLVDLRYNDELWKVETRMSETRRKFWYARYHLVELKALLELKLFQTVDFFVELLGLHLGTVKDEEVRVERKNLRWQLLCVLLSEAGAIFIVCSLVSFAMHGKIQVGSFAFYLGSLGALRLSLNSLSQNIGSQLRDGKFVRDMFELFDLERENGSQSKVQRQRVHSIEFRDVRFAYPGTDREVLCGVNLRLKAGQTLGIVAENGSGKTTLAKLLCRIYEPTSGAILVNGRDIREFELEEWRSSIGVMLQEYGHYEHLDIRTAIQLGRINDPAPGESVVKAAQRGDAHDFITALPSEYDTTLGRAFVGGVELSGGQYQKIAVSRMFYRDPEIAIFDEPTSAIDGDAEARIFEEILRGLPNCTKLLISHRYYTLRKADLICVLEHGKVAELGSHDELVALRGIYASRYKAQANEYV